MKNHILKLSSYPLSWKQYRFCKNDFPPTNSHLLLLPLFLRTSHLNGNLVFYKMCISNFESCACSLLGAVRRASSPPVYQLKVSCVLTSPRSLLAAAPFVLSGFPAAPLFHYKCTFLCYFFNDL